MDSLDSQPKDIKVSCSASSLNGLSSSLDSDLIEKALNERCQKHPSFNSDLLFLSNNAKSYKICYQCLSDMDLNTSKIISLRTLFTSPPEAILSNLSYAGDKELIQRIESHVGAVEKQQNQIIDFFKCLKESFNSLIEAAQGEVKTKIRLLSDEYKATFDLLSSLSEIKNLQNAVLNQNSDDQNNLNSFISSRLSLSKENNHKLRDQLNKFERILDSFSMESPNETRQMIVDFIHQLDFFTNNNQDQIPQKPPQLNQEQQQNHQQQNVQERYSSQLSDEIMSLINDESKQQNQSRIKELNDILNDQGAPQPTAEILLLQYIKYTQLEEQYSLKVENMNKEIESLKEENMKIIEKYQANKDNYLQFNELQNEISSLKDENMALCLQLEDNKTVQQIIDKMQKDIKVLSEKNKVLNLESESNKLLQEKVAKLEKENKQISDKNKVLDLESEQNRVVLEAMNQKIEEGQKEYESLLQEFENQFGKQERAALKQDNSKNMSLSQIRDAEKDQKRQEEEIKQMKEFFEQMLSQNSDKSQRK